ncbi:hypothetical protein HanIR_Chr14g0722221 [Helianthus annuus]|nr:hypothetical protein HanIR_Chr14g0722221 [Helianthus annuus]
MHHVVTLIAERQGVHALIGICLNCLCLRLDAKLQSSRGFHWKQPLYSYG